MRTLVVWSSAAAAPVAPPWRSGPAVHPDSLVAVTVLSVHRQRPATRRLPETSDAGRAQETVVVPPADRAPVAPKPIAISVRLHRGVVEVDGAAAPVDGDFPGDFEVVPLGEAGVDEGP